MVTTTNYIWNPVRDSCVMEKDETGTTTAVYTSEPVQYGRVVSQRRDNATTYYHYDGLGSTRELTDESENVVNTNLYDAWGVNVDSSETVENPFKWVGERGYYSDALLKGCYVREREYVPLQSRWISADLLLVFGGVRQDNRYEYALNSPIRYVDPSGQIIEPEPLITFWTTCRRIARVISDIGLNTPEERKMFQHFTSRRGTTFLLDKSAARAIAFANDEFLTRFREAKKQCALGNKVTVNTKRIAADTVHPWKLGLGRVWLYPQFSCNESCDLCWAIRIEDTYDFNQKKKGGRTAKAEFNVALVRYAAAYCLWRAFPVRGYAAGGCD